MPITEIGPPDVKHDENSMQILYLSTSMGSRIMENVERSRVFIRALAAELIHFR